MRGGGQGGSAARQPTRGHKRDGRQCERGRQSRRVPHAAAEADSRSPGASAKHNTSSRAAPIPRRRRLRRDSGAVCPRNRWRRDNLPRRREHPPPAAPCSHNSSHPQMRALGNGPDPPPRPPSPVNTQTPTTGRRRDAPPPPTYLERTPVARLHRRPRQVQQPHRDSGLAHRVDRGALEVQRRELACAAAPTGAPPPRREVSNKKQSNGAARGRCGHHHANGLRQCLTHGRDRAAHQRGCHSPGGAARQSRLQPGQPRPPPRNRHHRGAVGNSALPSA